MKSKLIPLLDEVAHCTRCSHKLPHAPRPVLQVHPKAKVLIAGQAPGRAVHMTGIPFNDQSGRRLREWLGLDETIFYDAEKVAIVPMGFCYPGKGPGGDRAPIAECARTWRSRILETLVDVEVTLVVGRYAQAFHLNNTPDTLTETVKAWRSYWPTHVPLPHPSPRNNIWLKKNTWFERDLLPPLRQHLADLLCA